MTAFSHTSWTVYCDAENCQEQVTDDESFDRRVTRASVRRYLARRSWSVNVGATRRGNGDDYCPAHKALAAKGGLRD